MRITTVSWASRLSISHLFSLGYVSSFESTRIAALLFCMISLATTGLGQVLHLDGNQDAENNFIIASIDESKLRIEEDDQDYLLSTNPNHDIEVQLEESLKKLS